MKELNKIDLDIDGGDGTSFGTKTGLVTYYRGLIKIAENNIGEYTIYNTKITRNLVKMLKIRHNELERRL